MEVICRVIGLKDRVQCKSTHRIASAAQSRASRKSSQQSEPRGKQPELTVRQGDSRPFSPCSISVVPPSAILHVRGAKTCTYKMISFSLWQVDRWLTCSPSANEKVPSRQGELSRGPNLRWISSNAVRLMPATGLFFFLSVVCVWMRKE